MVRKYFRLFKISLIVLGLVLFISSCSKKESENPPPSANDPGVLNGTPISSQEFPSVGLVKGPNFLCSGTLIASDIVLTANHCTQDESGNLVSLKFTLAAQYSTAASWTTVSSIQRYSTQDVAILKLATPLIGVEVSEITLSPATQSFLNRNVEIVGYGDSKTSSGTVKEDSGAGIKRKGTSLLFRLDDNQATLVSKPSTTNQVVCPGDSGGPMFISNQGRRQLFGVASAVRWGGYCATVQESYHKQVAYSQTKTWLLNKLAAWYTRVPIYRSINPAGQFVYSRAAGGSLVFKLINVPGSFSNDTCTTPLVQCKTSSGALYLNAQSCGTTDQFERLLGYACNGYKTSQSPTGSFDLWRVDNVQNKTSLSTSLQEAQQLARQNSSWQLKGFLNVHVLPAN